MEKIFDTSDNALIDLGSVSKETRGSAVGIEDTNGGRHVGAGLTDD